MKRLFFILLFLHLLPTLSMAARDTVHVSTVCYEGNAFTIRIPVKFPENMRIDYVWYRNDTAVTETLTANENKISYTIPDTAAYGTAAFHFKYRCSDGCDEWTNSPKFVVNFLPLPPPQPSDITGSAVVCANAAGLTYSVNYAAGVTYAWSVPEGWEITAGENSNSITVTAGTAGGNISVTLSNSGGSGAASTLNVRVVECGVVIEWCDGITSPGTIDDGICTGITAAGSIENGACTGITSAGSIEDGACTGITSAGSIDNGACAGVTSAGSIKW